MASNHLLTCGMQHESRQDSCDEFLPFAGGSNYNVPVPGAAAGALAKDNVLAGFEDDLSRTIVDLEVNADQWTLMHRYNKAAELIEQSLQARAPAPWLVRPLHFFFQFPTVQELVHADSRIPSRVLSIVAQPQASPHAGPQWCMHKRQCVIDFGIHTLTCA